MRSLGRLLMLATLITGAILIVLPAAASADARVSTQVFPTPVETRTRVPVPT